MSNTSIQNRMCCDVSHKVIQQTLDPISIAMYAQTKHAMGLECSFLLV